VCHPDILALGSGVSTPYSRLWAVWRIQVTCQRDPATKSAGETLGGEANEGDVLDIRFLFA